MRGLRGSCFTMFSEDGDPTSKVSCSWLHNLNVSIWLFQGSVIDGPVQVSVLNQKQVQAENHIAS